MWNGRCVRTCAHACIVFVYRIIKTRVHEMRACTNNKYQSVSSLNSAKLHRRVDIVPYFRSHVRCLCPVYVVIERVMESKPSCLIFAR